MTQAEAKLLSARVGLALHDSLSKGTHYVAGIYLPNRWGTWATNFPEHFAVETLQRFLNMITSEGASSSPREFLRSDAPKGKEMEFASWCRDVCDLTSLVLTRSVPPTALWVCVLIVPHGFNTWVTNTSYEESVALVRGLLEHKRHELGIP
jgi:hypothetical protein